MSTTHTVHLVYRQEVLFNNLTLPSVVSEADVCCSVFELTFSSYTLSGHGLSCSSNISGFVPLLGFSILWLKVLLLIVHGVHFYLDTDSHVRRMDALTFPLHVGLKVELSEPPACSHFLSSVCRCYIVIGFKYLFSRYSNVMLEYV